MAFLQTFLRKREDFQISGILAEKRFWQTEISEITMSFARSEGDERLCGAFCWALLGAWTSLGYPSVFARPQRSSQRDYTRRQSTEPPEGSIPFHHHKPCIEIRFSNIPRSRHGVVFGSDPRSDLAVFSSPLIGAETGSNSILLSFLQVSTRIVEVSVKALTPLQILDGTA